MLFNRSLPAAAHPTSITTLDGSDLEYVDNYKYLGVWLDCKLSFPIQNPQSKIKSKIGFLFRNKASFSHAAKLTRVNLTILPFTLHLSHLADALIQSDLQIGAFTL
jgi:hypothetical protein